MTPELIELAAAFALPVLTPFESFQRAVQFFQVLARPRPTSFRPQVR
ncbi:hypothetical protein [Streptomyces sp. 147326]